MPIGTTAALIGSAVIGAGSSIIGSSNNSKAISKSTDANLQAQREAIAAQERMAAQNMALQSNIYNTSGKLQTDIYNQNVSTLNPFTQTGYSAMNARNALLGLPEQQAYTPQQIAFTPIQNPTQQQPVAQQNALLPQTTQGVR